jgi:hypothetical protein
MVAYTDGNMRRQKTDYFTVAGIILFGILVIIYFTWDHIVQFLQGLSLDQSDRSDSLPGIIPNVNLDWFYAQDPASQIILCFLATVLLATLIGGSVILLIRRVSGARK